MSTMTMSRSNLWEVTSRTIVYAAIGAALYGILLVAQVPIPGTHRVGPAGVRARAVLRLRVRADRRLLHRLRRQRDRRPALRLGRPDVLELEPRQRLRRPARRPRAAVPCALDERRRCATAPSAAPSPASIAVVIGFLFVFTDIILRRHRRSARSLDPVHPGDHRRRHRDDHPRADPRVRLGAGEGPAGPLGFGARGRP